MFADYIREGKHEETIIDEEDPQTKLKRMLIPIGPVAVFGVSNFPLAFGACGGDTISALAAGCPVVAKGHPSHPQTSELFAVAMNKAIERAGFPKGTFSLLQGVKNVTGKNLVLHPAIKAVGFTIQSPGMTIVSHIPSPRLSGAALRGLLLLIRL